MTLNVWSCEEVNFVKNKIGKILANLSMRVATANVNSCCMYVMYQPELPKELHNLKKR